ncbi:MAG: D-alanyl-D-alanine carboxypeptidase [Candidatus Nealsonbacteria bacterium]|nr:D-alanyl-D-alanine carboxypeptidase [Candidatus Nealsonbacteria bacterium]
MASNSRFLSALTAEVSLNNYLLGSKPFKNNQGEGLQIGAKSAISLFFPSNPAFQDKILFQKSPERKLAIASLTKLMTAYTALKNYNLDQILRVSEEAVREEEDFGQLKIGERLSVENLLYLLLMESSNDAAYVLAENINKDHFLELMNSASRFLGLENTYFVNFTGLDPDEEQGPINYSSAQDLSGFVKELLANPIFWTILQKKEYDLFSPTGVFHHKLVSTNELLDSQEPWRDRIIGGKTGWTPSAKGCLILVLEAPKGKGYLINVILGSQDRFEEMKKLVNWVQESYDW